MLQKNIDKKNRKEKRISWGQNHYQRVGKTKRDALNRQNNKYRNNIDY